MKPDPRVNFLAVIAITTSAFIVTDIWFNLLILCASIMLSCAAGARWSDMRPHLRRLGSLAVLVFIIQALFFRGGRRIMMLPDHFFLYWFDLTVPSWLAGKGLLSPDGMEFGLYIVLRLGIIVMMSLYFNHSTSPTRFIAGLHRMGIPHTVGLGVNLALRFIPQMSREVEEMKQAQQARGRRFREGNVFRRVKKILDLMRPLVIRYIIRTKLLSQVLSARGYFPGIERSSLYRLRMNGRDYALLVSLISLVAAASLYRWM